MMGDRYFNTTALWPFFCLVVWWLCRVCRCRLIDGCFVVQGCVGL